MFGLFSKKDDPQKMFDQLMHDMKATVPKLRIAVAQAYANRRLVEQECQEMEGELKRLTLQIAEAIRVGEAAKQTALVLINRKKQLERELPDKKRELDIATAQAEETQTILNDYMREMDTKFIEIRKLFPQDKQAELLESYAKLKQAFEVGDDSHILDEVSRRIKERIERAREWWT